MRAHFCALSPDDVKFILCATADAHGGAGAGLAPNGGRRTDGRLRRACPLGADGRRGALSVRTALYNNVYCRAKAFPSAHHPTKSPHRRPNGRRWGLCCGRASARREQVFSLCRRAYRPFSWNGGRRRSLFRARLRPLRSWGWALRQRRRSFRLKRWVRPRLLRERGLLSRGDR